MFKWYKKKLCKLLGHKEEWYPMPPWICERCGENYKEERELKDELKRIKKN